jgi:probable HAF family extracellular repeat protein
LAAQEQSAAKKAPKYTVIDLGTLSGGSFSQATAANDTGVQSGLSDAPDGFQHAVLWHDSKITDISNHFPASTNSGAFSLNNSGQVLLDGELTTKDPNNENFCAYGTGLICRAYVWRNGSMAPLPTLGGPNNLVTWINDQGLATGIAETSKHDSTCPGTITPGGTGPQSLQFEGVLWGPFPGGVRVMRPLPGDTASMAFAVNRQGLVVGGSGSCSDTFLPGPAVAPHAVFWENGVPASMGNLGGTSNPDLFGIGTIAYVVNDNGTAVGEAALPGNATAHAFLWSKKLHHLKDLGTLPGDVHTAGLGLNNLDDVVGPSFDPDGNPRAYLYKDGTMYDLNALAGDDSPIYMLVAYGVNDHDEVVGFGVDANGDVHGFLATPNGVCDGTGDGKPRAIMSERAKEFLRHRLPYGWFEPKR